MPLFHRCAVLFGLIALQQVVLGHDLYLMPDQFEVAPGNVLRVVYQNGDDFPRGGSPLPLARLQHARLLSKSGVSEFEKMIAGSVETVAEVRTRAAGTSILTSSTKPNLLQLDAVKFKSYLEHENLSNALQWREHHGETGKPGRERYSKYAKSVIQVGAKSDGFFNERTGLTIEIVPESDPYALNPGMKLPVQVLFRGKPASDVAVESAWLENGKAVMAVIGRTDRDGRIAIPLKAPGPHRLHAIVMERCADVEAADWESFWASLTYELPSDAVR